MREVLIQVAVMLGACATIGLITYGLALAGEPQSAWFWYDIIGVCCGD
ncbi:hypothetical protein LWH94_16095 [Marinobacter sp. G11]|nr:hypothetical protein [Marinobacter sp. G11]MCE0760714.1 hypothetical protein [Marinobacter sp. G11]